MVIKAVNSGNTKGWKFIPGFHLVKYEPTSYFKYLQQQFFGSFIRQTLLTGKTNKSW